MDLTTTCATACARKWLAPASSFDSVACRCASANSGAGLRVGLSDGETLEVDQVLIATGRQPNTSGLGLEAAGVALDAAGAVVVDADSTTNIRSIHAVGDVTNRINLTPVAIREGHVLADHLFAGASVRADHHNVASAVFSTPEIGAVGLTERQAVERFPVVDIYKSNFRPMKATLTGGGERTIMKLVVDAASDRVVGAHIMGSEAGEMIQLLAIAIKMGATKADLDATVAVHPTASEELVTMRKRTARIRRRFQFCIERLQDVRHFFCNFPKPGSCWPSRLGSASRERSAAVPDLVSPRLLRPYHFRARDSMFSSRWVGAISRRPLLCRRALRAAIPGTETPRFKRSTIGSAISAGTALGVTPFFATFGAG